MGHVRVRHRMEENAAPEPLVIPDFFLYHTEVHLQMEGVQIQVMESTLSIKVVGVIWVISYVAL